MKLLKLTIVACALLVAMPVPAQDTQGQEEAAADNMGILRDKLKADKKLLVAQNMELTESEAKGFWPLYDAYQNELGSINDRLGTTIEKYADAYNKGAIPDDTAKQLIDEVLSIDDAETKLQRETADKLLGVIPAAKVARYLQIERKIRSVLDYDLAGSIPLVP